MKITQESWDVLVNPKTLTPTPQELFDFYIETLQKNGIIKNPDEFLPLSKCLPKHGQPFILIPQTNLTLDELMIRVVVGGLRGGNLLNDEGIKNVSKTPTNHYFAIGVEDGRKMLDISPEEAIRAFSKDKRSGLTAKEGVFLTIYFPEILKHHFIDLPGSRCRSDSVPSLYLYGDEPKLNWNDYSGTSISLWGSASCSNRIGRQNLYLIGQIDS